MSKTDEKFKFVELRAKGYTFDQCTKELNRSKQCLIDWQHEMQDDIANLKAIQIEALYNEFFLYKEARIKRMGKLLIKVEQELEKRDYSEVPTDKLHDFFIKLQNQITSEMIEPKFIDSKGKSRNDFHREMGL